jgi:hypothetical protein
MQLIMSALPFSWQNSAAIFLGLSGMLWRAEGGSYAHSSLGMLIGGDGCNGLAAKDD